MFLIGMMMGILLFFTFTGAHVVGHILADILISDKPEEAEV